jgi:hypothetical protein
MSAGLGRDDIRGLLDDLNDELAVRGARADLFLVGGAAIAVAYDEARSTRDLDAVFLPTDVVREAAAAVAERRGLNVDWLNDAVKGLGFTTVEEGLDLVERVYQGRPIEPKVQFLLGEIVDAMRERGEATR